MTERNEATNSWYEEALKKLHPKVVAMAKRNFGKIPYIATDGVYDDMNETSIAWWTNGFFAGELWEMYHAYGDESLKQTAEKVEELLDRSFVEYLGLHHDVGFMWLHTAVANYRLTGNEKSKTRALHAANLLAGRFNIKGSFIRSWNHQNGWTIVDSLMNIPLLYWASEELDDPRYKQIAIAHADTLLKYLVRPDGSVGHIASFNAETGEFIEQIAGQGYGPDSAWTRGQAWAIYGYALSYFYTKEVRYLDAAKKIANYFIANVSQTDYLTIVDFKAPYEEIKYDASAGTCAAAGMLLIADLLAEEEGSLYHGAAENILKATLENWVNWDETQDGIVQNSSHSYHQKEESLVPIIYGDYFFVEALLHLAKKDFLIW